MQRERALDADAVGSAANGERFADRAVAADSIDILADMALIIFALYSGRSVFLDIAFITAILGFVGSTIVARYLEGRL